ncbi:hypothetical protein EV175_002473 [Coemansia sp. RSA 1933]|nr:hypothetical protein EV175_002473 [Coemansia sp. RSA 1933]
MFARSKDNQKSADTNAEASQQPMNQLEKHSIQIGTTDARYSNIAPRPVPGQHQHQQQMAQNASIKRPSVAPKSSSRQSIPKSKQTAPKGKQRTVARQPTKTRTAGKSGARCGASKTKDTVNQVVSNISNSSNSSNSNKNTVQPQMLPFEADDLLIQELLAGIPSTAWLPTDPLTSEGWFNEPVSSLISQDSAATHSQKGHSSADIISSLEHSSTVATNSALASLQQGLMADALSCQQETVNSPLASTSLVGASGQSAQATPDARLMASLRAKKDTPLISRHNAKKGNPLSGFAKKHGIGFPVGNQMAILSPVLLSSSPPNAKQLRTHPYKYYSPPKPSQRPSQNQTKGRNLLLGRNSPLRIQASTRHASKDGRLIEAASTGQMGVSGTEPGDDPRSNHAISVTSASAHSNANSSSNPGATRIGIKWEIAQDKLLLRGVRQQRWMDITKPRDPNRFLGNDWEVISQGVTIGSDVVRSARQCRRRWAVMHSHLGTAIMDFVDSAPTPQSSAQSTPVPRGGLTPDSRLNDSKPTNAAPSHVRNLRLASLPMSSPPFIPASGRPRDADTNSPARGSDELVDCTQKTSHTQPSTHATDTTASSSDPVRMLGFLGLDPANPSKRWSSPAYCQFVTDVVQALSNPDSEAAAVVQRYAQPAGSALHTTTDSASVTSLPTATPLFSLADKSSDGNAITSGSSRRGSQAMPSRLQQQIPAVRGMNETLGKVISTPRSISVDSANLPASAVKPVALGKTQDVVSLGQRLGTLCAADQISKDSATAAGALPNETDTNPMDQDLSVYLEFLQSLTNEQGSLDTAWTTLFDDPRSSSTLSAINASSIAGIGAGAGTGASTSASTAPVAAIAATSSGFSTSSVLAMEPIEASEFISKLGSSGSQKPKQSLPIQTNTDDEDASDGDFVLNDFEEFDDEDDDEDDNDNDNGDEDDEDGDDDDEADDDEPNSPSSKGGTEITASLLKPLPTLPSTTSAEAEAAVASLADISRDAWNMTLEQLGFSTGSTSLLSTSVADGNGSNILGSDALFQQLIHGVPSGQKIGIGNLDIGSSMSTPSSASLPAWLPTAADPSAILPQWTGSGTSMGAGLDLGQNNKLTDALLASLAGANTLLPTANATEQRSTQCIQASNVSGKNALVAGEGNTSSSGAAKDKAVDLRKLQPNQRVQDLTASELISLARLGKAKTPRKRKKKAAAASIAKALSAAAAIDADGFIGLEQNGMDTEMSGLYQDALQEGEEIDVQEELLIADNSEFMFTAEQMSQLREQQVQNFQFVTQSFLITCAESGPHGRLTRHWKGQLDQLALWHSLGTRESPSDMMSSGGLQQFGELIESAERVRARTGTIGMSESGRFAPNPASFFAIPGITVVIPEIYEAVDEIHRTTQLSANHETTAKGEQSGSTNSSSGSGGGGGKKDGRGSSAKRVPEVRSFDENMGFTRECKCTALTRGFKSAMVRECVFPKVFKQVTRRSKRKTSADVADSDGRVQGSSGDKHLAVQVQESPVLSARRDSGSVGGASGSSAGSGLLQLPGTKLLAPLIKPISRQNSASHDSGNNSSTSSGDMCLAIMQHAAIEAPPVFTEAEIRLIVEEMKGQIRGFKRDVHRVPRSRRRIFVQGSDGVARLEWMKVNIEPLTLPATMHGLVDTLVMYSGFQDAMLPRIIVVRKPKNRIHFLESEDSLLLQGLRLFGLEDVASVRAHLLPCKTVSQLRNRMNNMRARRAPPNPVKDFCLRRIAPFTLEEEETLRLGLLVYGDEFKQQDKNFLVNRPILALMHVWNQIRKPQAETAAAAAVP